jgi:hypothetical protein
LLKLVPVGRPLAVRYVRDGNAAEAMLEPRDLIPD